MGTHYRDCTYNIAVSLAELRVKIENLHLLFLVYLLQENSLNLKKSKKADLTNSLLKILDKEDIVTCDDDSPGRCPHVQSDAIIVDLMSILRKLSSVELSAVTTFGSLCDTLLRVIQSYGSKSDEIHIIMENYKHISIKSAERRNRQESIGKLCHVQSDEQPLPIMDDFYSRLENKISLQHFFVNYCFRHYTSSKPLYIAGGLEGDPKRCSLIVSGIVREASFYRSSHEEADDRMMFSIQQIYLRIRISKSTPTIIVVTPDADIFIGLLYHLKNTWQDTNLYMLKKGKIKITKKYQKELYPLHLLIPKLDPHIIDNLPAGHSLTGCDTVAKVGTKTDLLKALKYHHILIDGFGKDRMDGDTISSAEKCLVKVVVSRKNESDCTTFNELRVKQYQQSMKKKFVDLPCTSNAIQQNIKRAYLQTKLWLESPFGNIAETMDPNEYGHIIDLNSNLVDPLLFIGPARPVVGMYVRM